MLAFKTKLIFFSMLLPSALLCDDLKSEEYDWVFVGKGGEDLADTWRKGANYWYDKCNVFAVCKEDKLTLAEKIKIFESINSIKEETSRLSKSFVLKKCDIGSNDLFPVIDKKKAELSDLKKESRELDESLMLLKEDCRIIKKLKAKKALLEVSPEGIKKKDNEIQELKNALAEEKARVANCENRIKALENLLSQNVIVREAGKNELGVMTYIEVSNY